VARGTRKAGPRGPQSLRDVAPTPGPDPVWRGTYAARVCCRPSLGVPTLTYSCHGVPLLAALGVARRAKVGAHSLRLSSLNMRHPRVFGRDAGEKETRDGSLDSSTPDRAVPPEVLSLPRRSILAGRARPRTESRVVMCRKPTGVRGVTGRDQR
ncbi:hypothetical protein KI387_032436, partial [Taxus chinensis]